MNRDLYPIELQIHQAVSEKCREMYAASLPEGQWKLPLNDVLAALARENGLTPLYSRPPDNAEWLWDMTWLDTKDEWRQFRGAYLVCETEWRPYLHEHLRDFMKLVVADAKYRLFICGVFAGEADARMQALRAASVELPGKRFLVICVPPKDPGGPLPHLAWTT